MWRSCASALARARGVKAQTSNRFAAMVTCHANEAVVAAKQAMRKKVKAALRHLTVEQMAVQSASPRGTLSPGCALSKAAVSVLFLFITCK